MDKQVIVIEQKVPTCPICSASMWKRYQDGKLFFVCCDDISHIYGMIDNGQTENELLVTDTVKVKKKYKYLKEGSEESIGILDGIIDNLNKLPKYFICWGNRGNNCGGKR